MKNSQKGSMLVVLIAGILIVGAIGAGVSAMISSGARSGADQNLSVQAFYAAESGLEWAGFRLREEVADWRDYCANSLTGESDSLEGGSSFRIDDSRLLPEGVDLGETTACRVTVEGWVGDYNNPMALRRITGRVTDTFIEATGGTPDNVYGGDGVEINASDIDVSTHSTAYILDGTIIDGELTLMPHSEVYFGERVEVMGNVTLRPNGYAYFGDSFYIDGDIEIKDNACFGNNVRIEGYLTLKDGSVCIGDDLRVEKDFSIETNVIVCIGDYLAVGENFSIDNNAVVNIGDNLTVGGNFSIGNNAKVCIGQNLSSEDPDEASNSKVCYDCTVWSECSHELVDDDPCDDCSDLCEAPDFPTGTAVPPNPAGTEDGHWDEA